MLVEYCDNDQSSYPGTKKGIPAQDTAPRTWEQASVTTAEKSEPAATAMLALEKMTTILVFGKQQKKTFWPKIDHFTSAIRLCEIYMLEKTKNAVNKTTNNNSVRGCVLSQKAPAASSNVYNDIIHDVYTVMSAAAVDPETFRPKAPKRSRTDSASGPAMPASVIPKHHKTHRATVRSIPSRGPPVQVKKSKK